MQGKVSVGPGDSLSSGPLGHALAEHGLILPIMDLSDRPETVADLLSIIPSSSVILTQGQAASDARTAALRYRTIEDPTYSRLVRATVIRLQPPDVGSVLHTDRGDRFEAIHRADRLPPRIWATVWFGPDVPYVNAYVPDDGTPLELPVYSGEPSEDLIRMLAIRVVLDGLDFHFEPRIPFDQHDNCRMLFRAAFLLPASSAETSVDGRPFREWVEGLIQEHRFTSGAPLAPALPAARLIKTATEAEQYAAEVMRALGYDDAQATPPGADGGIDVNARAAVAQVKMEGVLTGRPTVQAIFGVASVERKEALVFSLAGYTAQALEWAERAGVACFEFRFDGSVQARSSTARDLLDHGRQVGVR